MKLLGSIDSATKSLKMLQSTLTMLSKPTISQKTIDYYDQSSRWIQKLIETKQIIELRKEAFEILNKLNTQELEINEKNEDEVMYFDKFISFTSARFLIIQSYITIAWTIIDNISAVIGYILLPENNTKNLIYQKKLHKFLDEKDGLIRLGTNLYTNITKNYGWPVMFFYYLRNLIIHQGESVDGNYIFMNNSFAKDVFVINDDVMKTIQNYITKKDDSKNNNYKASKEDSRRNKEEWDDTDLFVVLQKCEFEIDELLSILLEYSTKVLNTQAKLFLQRDISEYMK